jgi:hypothetical protein
MRNYPQILLSILSFPRNRKGNSRRIACTGSTLFKRDRQESRQGDRTNAGFIVLMPNLPCCLDSPLQGALTFAKANRSAGAQHAVRNPCYTLRGNDGV